MTDDADGVEAAAEEAEAESADAAGTETVETDPDGADAPNGDTDSTDATDGEESLAAEVAAHDETLAAAVADVEAEREELAATVTELESENEELTERLQRTQADFQNYKKRAKRRQDEIEERATEDLVTRLLDVRDDLMRALEEESGDVDSLREGVELTKRELDEVFAAEGVEEIAPDPGAETDPHRHEAMMRVPSDEPAGTVAEVYRPGYEMGGKVLRAAQVTVSDGPADGEE